MEGRSSLPNNSLMITYDDGYRDNYSIAYHIFKKLGIPATIFIETGLIDRKKYNTWEKDV